MYFTQLKTVEEIKKHYYRLAMQYHPDKGGDTRIMQDINNAYFAALKACDGQTSKGFDDKEHTYYYSPEAEGELADKLSEVIAASAPHWRIMLIGSWLWIDGTTRTDKDRLNKNGCKCLWHTGKNMWYWRPKTARSWSKGKGDINNMAWKYGYREFKKYDSLDA